MVENFLLCYMQSDGQIGDRTSRQIYLMHIYVFTVFFIDYITVEYLP